MSSYQQYVQKFAQTTPSTSCDQYNAVGTTYHIKTDQYDGYYWLYEADQFTVSIHDGFVKEDYIYDDLQGAKQYFSYSSTYIIMGEGERFHPYQTLTPNLLFIMDAEKAHENYKFLFHGQSHVLTVTINFKRQMIDGYLDQFVKTNSIDYSELFGQFNHTTSKAFEPLAQRILQCQMDSPAAELFFEAAAKEWLSLIVTVFIDEKKHTIPISDKEALCNVAQYIDHHYSMTISQQTLEKIAMMSGTKLKKKFKQCYRMTITEYTQRCRMNMGKTLLLHTNLPIQSIAEAVGYSSPSKFTSYFKRFKGVTPSQLRKSRKNSLDK